jgi:hypothetical protein
LAVFGVKTFYDAGEFKEIKPHFNGKVQTIAGVLSSEDITIHPQTAMAFISSDDRRAHRPDGRQARQGAIYGFDLNSVNPKPMNLTADFSQEINNHVLWAWLFIFKMILGFGRFQHTVLIPSQRIGLFG